MPDLKKLYLYRMTHFENIPHILQYGITHASSPNANPNFVPIGDNSLISTRSKHKLENERLLGEYIPFYFGLRMPMLYVIQKGYNLVKSTPAEHIVYCVTSIHKIIEEDNDYVFTDGHAVDSFSTLYKPSDVNNIDQLIDKNAINAKYWKDENDLDLKRRKEAEFLILGDIPLSAIFAFVVFNQAAKEKLINFGVKESIIYVKPGAYF